MQLTKPHMVIKEGLMQNKRGFTLVELMIAVLIVGIMAAVGGPALQQYLQFRGLKTATNQLRGDLQAAKLEAIKRNTNCSINVSVLPPLYNNSWTGLNKLLSSYRGGVSFIDPGPDGTPSAVALTFTPGGICTSPGSVFLTSTANAATTYRVRISAAGGISEHIWIPATNTWR